MTLTHIFGGINYALVCFFGVALSVSIAGGCQTRRDRAVILSLLPIFLALQTGSWLMLGLEATKQLYPLLVHLPLLVALIFGLKRTAGISLVSICAAYLCCQLPRCADVVATALIHSELVGEITYTIVIAPIFFLLRRYFVPSAREAMAVSPRSLLLFGSLPVLFYIFAYATAIYSDLLYSGSQVVAEALPTIGSLFYLFFTTAYHRQLQARAQAELQGSLMAGQLKQAELEMISLRQAEVQAAAYQHDMRHHLTAINAFLDAGKPRQAENYIKQVRADIEAITPKRFCENELVNLLCSSFGARAERMGARLAVEAALPSSVSISDTELCALLSNGLENALNAVEKLEEDRRWVEFYCGVRLDKLLIEIKNPCTGQISFRDGVPESTQPGHGYGCRSIRTITQLHRGLCEFQAESGIFTLRVALPM